MKYLNTYDKLFEMHWKDELIKGDKLSFHRKNSIEEIFYELMDDGYDINIYQELYDDDFGSPGKKIDFLDDNKNLYEGYRVAFSNSSIDPMNIDKIIEHKEEEIVVLKRLQDMGFVMRMSGGYNPQVSLYHKDDIISKGLFIGDLSAGKIKKFRGNLEEAEEKLTKTFGKIAHVWKSYTRDDDNKQVPTGNLIMQLDPHGNGDYTLDQLYEFTKKVLKVGFTITKVMVLRRSTEPDAIQISVKKFK